MLAIILMTPLVARAEERDKAEEIRLSVLKESKGDTTVAFVSLSEKTSELLVVHRDALDELELSKRHIERVELHCGYNDKNWVETTWDSDAMKVIILGFGIWLGIEASNAN